ncbi:MAG: AzlD domain-containing protein [Trueperaceae bacterium]|nr:MAG: AzlD domain-containing protein [Trueperaceae bacterium]
MTRPEVWFTIVGMALVTFALRGSFLLAADRTTLRPLVQRALRYVPPAVLAAIVAPALAQPSGAAIGPFDLRLIAGLVAGLVAWRTRGILATFGTGMLTLWGLTWLLG